MKSTVTVAPVLLPLEVEDAKAHLRVTHQSEDASVEACIAAAVDACEKEVGRSLITQTRRVYYDAWPDCGIALPYGPVQSVTSVEYVDSAGATQTLAGTEYLVDLLDNPPRIVPAFGKSWPSTRAQRNAVWSTYVAGYGATGAALPAQLRQWLLLYVGALWEHREAVTATPVEAAGFAAGLLDAYREVRL